VARPATKNSITSHALIVIPVTFTLAVPRDSARDIRCDCEMLSRREYRDMSREFFKIACLS